MQYQVPQFIEIEDKIFGPLTFKQFLYVGGGAAMGFIIWSFLPKILAVLIGGPIVVFFMMAAFYQVNGRPFLMFIEGALKYSLGTKLYVWRKIDAPIQKKKEVQQASPQVELPRLSQSKLREISWGLDVHEEVNHN